MPNEEIVVLQTMEIGPKGEKEVVRLVDAGAGKAVKMLEIGLEERYPLFIVKGFVHNTPLLLIRCRKLVEGGMIKPFVRLYAVDRKGMTLRRIHEEPVPNGRLGFVFSREARICTINGAAGIPVLRIECKRDEKTGWAVHTTRMEPGTPANPPEGNSKM